MTDEQFIEAIETLLPEDRKLIEEYILYLKDWHSSPISSDSSNEPLSGDEFLEIRGRFLSEPPA